MRTTISAVAFAALLASGLASAVEVKERGAYIGGAVGSTEIDADFLDNAESLGLRLDDSDTGLQLWGGYKFLKWFAVEGRYSDLGEYSISSASSIATIESSAVTANAVFILPFGNSGIDIYGQVGLGFVAYEVKEQGYRDADDTGSVGAAGVGVRWTPAPPVTISLGIDAWTSEVEIEATGEEDDVSITMARLGVQYNF